MSETLDELKKRLAEQEAKTDFWRRATLTLISHTVDTAEYEGMRSGTSNTALERYWSICRECLEILFGEWNRHTAEQDLHSLESNLRLVMLKLQGRLKIVAKNRKSAR